MKRITIKKLKICAYIAGFNYIFAGFSLGFFVATLPLFGFKATWLLLLQSIISAILGDLIFNHFFLKHMGTKEYVTR